MEKMLRIAICSIIAAGSFLVPVAVHAGSPYDLKQTIAEVQMPERVFTNEAGNVTVDFGKDAFGWLEICAPAPGLEYFLALGEHLMPNGVVGRSPGRCVRAEGVAWHTEKAGFQRIPVSPDLRNSFSAKEGDPAGVRPEFGLVMPFRAVEIYKAAFPVTKDTVRRHVVTYPANRTESSFACSDARLEKVYGFCKHTMFATSFAGKFVDGDRERIPYEADAYASQLNWYAVSSDYAYPRTSIEYLYSHPTWPTEFQQISVLSAWTDWMWTGDTGSLKKHYGLLKDNKLLTRFERKEDGLVFSGGEKCRPHGCNRFGLADIADWPAVERDGFDFRDVNAIVNAFHYRSLLAMADIAGAIGEASDAAEFRHRVEKLKKTFGKTFFDGNTGLFVDGEGSRHSSLHVNALAVAFGLAEGERAQRISDWLAMRGMACSVYFSQYLMEALFKTGRADAAIALMTASHDRSWLGMLAYGATMTMESWNMLVKPNMDWNHSWGATPLNAISRFLCGVTPLKPGFVEMSVEPAPGPLEKLEASVPTQAGVVKIKIDGDRLDVDAPAPAVVRWRGRTVRTKGGKATVEPAKMVLASSFGFNPDDATQALQKAFDSGAGKVVVDRQVSDWVCGPLYATNSNIEIVFQEGATLRAREGAFGGPDDHLLTICGATNVTVRRLAFRVSGGGGVRVENVRNLLLDRVVCKGASGDGLNVVSVYGLEVRRCSFSSARCGLRIKPDGDCASVENMLFEECDFGKNETDGIGIDLSGLKRGAIRATAAFRCCTGAGNVGNGLSTCASRSGGKIVFEHCRFHGNGKRAALLANQVPGSVSIGFRKCTFDLEGGSGKEAILLDNSGTAHDFGGVAFGDDVVIVRGNCEPLGFSGKAGYGVADVEGILHEDRNGYRQPYRMDIFKESHSPSSVGVCNAAADLVLCERGEAAKTAIVLPANPGPSAKYAAEELQRYVEKMTDVKLPLVEGEAKGKGQSIRLVQTGEYGTDGFRIRVKGGTVEISGGRRGILYGVYELLETHGGCGWYASWHEAIPRKDAFSVQSDLDDIQKPAFEMRMPTWQDVRENAAFAARLRVNGHACDGAPDMMSKLGGSPMSFVRGLGNCHTFGRILPPKKYFQEHPDWFSEVKGVRRDGRTQICLTNPEAFEQSYSNICEYIERDIVQRRKAGSGAVADMLVAGVSQGDWHNFCECADCKAIDDREESHAGSLLHFVNRMADRLAERYPGLKTETLVYQYTRKAPKTMRPNGNVIPCLCSIECSFAKPLAERGDRHNSAFMDDLEKWGRLSKNLYVWDYTMRPHHYFHPFPNVHVLGPNLQAFRDNNVKYVFAQGGPTYGEFAQLKGWLLAKLMWNPDQPLEPLLDRFFRGHYGAAAPYVREYFDRVERTVIERENVRFTIWEKDRPDLFPDSFVSWARGVFAKAKEAVKGDALLSKNVRIAAFTPVCLNLDRRAAEAKRVWVTRNPSRYGGTADVEADLAEAFALASELYPKTKRIKVSELHQRNRNTWQNWCRLKDFRIPEKGSDSVVLGVRDMNCTSCAYGEFTKDPEAFGGECVKVFNKEDWMGPLTLSFGNVAYDGDAEYTVRFRAKVDPVPGGKGEAFNAEFAGMRIAPTVEEAGTGWKWYAYRPLKLKDSHVFHFKSGRFSKGGGRGAVNATYIDRLEISRK